MTEFDNNMTGRWFKNDRRETTDQPVYKGDCEVNGVEFWISGWTHKRDGTPNLTKAGVPFVRMGGDPLLGEFPHRFAQHLQLA